MGRLAWFEKDLCSLRALVWFEFLKWNGGKFFFLASKMQYQC